MKTINSKGQEIDQELYGQLSHTGKPFDCGYYISLFTGSYYFAKGEEKQRDKLLKEKGVYDEETPNWELLHQEYEDDFYYSEWFVEDDLDGGYDEDGNYYLYDNIKKVFVWEQ